MKIASSYLLFLLLVKNTTKSKYVLPYSNNLHVYYSCLAPSGYWQAGYKEYVSSFSDLTNNCIRIKGKFK